MKWLGIVTALALALFVGYGIYAQLNKPSVKLRRLPCQQEVTCFERSYAPDQLQEAVTLLQQRAYRISVSAQPSVYMKSRLFESVDTADIERVIAEAIERRIPQHEGTPAAAEEPLLIQCLIYENDKKDPGKKSKKAFLFEGYLLFSLSLGEKILYKFQIDFMEPKGADIPKRIDCLVQSILTQHKEH